MIFSQPVFLSGLLISLLMQILYAFPSSTVRLTKVDFNSVWMLLALIYVGENSPPECGLGDLLSLQDEMQAKGSPGNTLEIPDCLPRSLLNDSASGRPETWFVLFQSMQPVGLWSGSCD